MCARRLGNIQDIYYVAYPEENSEKEYKTAGFGGDILTARIPSKYGALTTPSFYMNYLQHLGCYLVIHEVFLHGIEWEFHSIDMLPTLWLFYLGKLSSCKTGSIRCICKSN